MTIHFSAFIVVLVLGIIGVVIAAVRENNLSSTLFFYLAYWVTALAFLYPGS